MKLLNFISIFFIPFLLFLIVLYGLFQKKPLFDLFTKGAKDGITTVYQIAPTIIGLFVAIGVFRSSGALDLLCNLLAPSASFFHIPTPILPLSLLKMFSASGANGLLFDLFKSYGTDSYIGFTASILLSCTETLFYTVSVYYMSVGIKKTRWTIPAGIFLSICSLWISCMLARYFIQ
ncbi:MAG: spore maturation protein [Lachnospiraceae bacterium]|nr:spore maturation protein [Lachnospiraceae bacterium]